MPEMNINILPNSGHHFYFFPIVFEVNAPKDSIQNFYQAYQIEIIENPTLAGHFSRAVGQERKWKTASGDNMTWLRYCIGDYYYIAKKDCNFKGCKVFGIWIAIETATGSRSRGHTWFTEEAPAQDAEEYQEYLDLAEKEEELSSPYAGFEENDLFYWDDEIKRINLLDCCELDDQIDNELMGKDIELILKINWQRYQGGLVNVALIVDLGNSRTTVMGFEVTSQLAANDSLAQVCRPITFPEQIQDAIHRLCTFKGTSEQLPESWFILKQPRFDTNEFIPDSINKTNLYANYEFSDVTQEIKEARGWGPWKKEVIIEETETVLSHVAWKTPQMFVELSPTVIGQKAKSIFASIDIANMGNTFLSAPKRYLWDTDAVGSIGQGQTFWRMVKHDMSTDLLEGEVLRYMRTRGEHYLPEDLNETLPLFELTDRFNQPVRNPSAPNYSRSDSLIWLALSIIEQAWEQINSEAWRNGNQPLIRRTLKDIVVTYPPGWTVEERKAYYRAWIIARNIFYWSRFPYMEEDQENEENNNFPELRMNVDEAIAAQLPIIYSNLKHLKGSSRIWCKLYGKQRYAEEQETVRVMSFDLGGGTTDTAIVDYTNTTDDMNRISLKHELLFSDSSIIAGDNLVFEIINHFILPQLAQPFLGNQIQLQDFKNVLSDSFLHQTNRIRNTMLIKTIFMPLVIKWFDDFKYGQKGDSNQKLWSLAEAAKNTAQAADGLRQFNRLFYVIEGVNKDILEWNKPFYVDYDELTIFIENWIKSLTDNLSRFVAALDCDLVIISGKISELPQIKKVLMEYLPIEHERLIFAHDSYVGNWFPGSIRGRISDAKMVTVTGAALFHAMERGFISGWNFERATGENAIPVKNYWGRLDPGNTDNIIKDETSLLVPTQDTWEVNLSIGDMIGRTRFLHTALQPVYKLRWNIPDPELRGRMPIVNVSVTLTRVMDNDLQPPTEYLKLQSVEGSYYDDNGQSISITLDDIELKLQTLPGDGEYWLDSGILDTTILDTIGE